MLKHVLSAYLGHCPRRVDCPPSAALALWRNSPPRVSRSLIGLYRIFAWQGESFPKVETRFVLLTVLPLCQAWHIGGLHLASPVPFRASYFTTRKHSAAATAQRHADCLCNQQDYGFGLLFVHFFNTLS